jgi:hypothetical protein
LKNKKLLAMMLLVLLAIPATLVAGPNPGDPAPNFSLPDTAGISHALLSYRGHVVHLQFWDSG